MTLAEHWLKERCPQVLGKQDFAYNFMKFHDAWKVRDEFIRNFGFAILDDATIDKMKAALQGVPILEVGAGSGYWGEELRMAGFDIISTDPGKGKYYLERENAVTWTPLPESVVKMDAESAIEQYGEDRAMMMVWPDYNDDWAARAVQAYKGNLIIYVGEGAGGCCGTDELHDELRNFGLFPERIYIPRFPSIHDYMMICQRL